MASLASTIQKNKNLVRDQQGNLVETTQEEVQSLAQKAGLAAPPTTPIGVGMIGGTPDQAKMAGTPAQKQAALNLSASPEQSLQDVMRRQQARSQATTGEQQKIQKSQDLQNLGSVGDRVSALINKQREALVEQQATLQAAEEVSSRQGEELSPDDLASARGVLQQLSVNPTNMELQKQLNELLGYDVNRQLAPDEIRNLYIDVTQSIAQSGAQAIDNYITAADLIEQGDFGYTAEELSQLLGVPLEQVGALTIAQIHDRINQAVASEFSQSQQLEQQATSNVLGTAERSIARQAGREASATGIRATESDMQRLEQSLARADIVSFAGKEMTIEEALSDDNITKVITEYLQSAPGSPVRTQLEQTEPQLVQFITQNQEALADAADQVAAGAQQFQELQKTNLETASNLVPSDLLDDLIPSLDKLSSAALDINSIPILAAAQGLGPDQQIQFRTSLGELSKLPGATGELSNLSADQIKALQLDRPNGLWNVYANKKAELARKKEQMDAAGRDPDAVIGALFDNQFQGGFKDFQHEYQSQYMASLLGLPNAYDQYAPLDKDGDNRIDPPAHLVNILSNVADQSYTLEDILAGKQPVSSSVKLPDDPSARWNTEQSTLYNRLSGAVKDGTLNYDELIGSRLGYEDLLKLDTRTPALDKTRVMYTKALSERSFADVSRKYNLKDPEEIVRATKELTSNMDTIINKLTKEGMDRNKAAKLANDYYFSAYDALYKKMQDLRSADSGIRVDLYPRNVIRANMKKKYGY